MALVSHKNGKRQWQGSPNSLSSRAGHVPSQPELSLQAAACIYVWLNGGLLTALRSEGPTCRAERPGKEGLTRRDLAGCESQLGAVGLSG